MGSLSNLYISQSYQSLTHFGNNSSASTTLVELEDGVGNGLGISLNTLGDLDVERQLIVHYGAEITGAVDINTTFSGSTQPFVNQSSVNNLIRITGSYTPTGNQASITEIGIGWLVNGGAVSNGRVINVTGTPNSDVTYTINQPLTANNVSYSFTGSIQREVEIEGDLNVSDDLFVGGHLIIEDGVEITGSIDITGNVTASNALIENDLTVVGTINAYKLNVTIESSSVIFSSGSNVLGDSTSDTQTLIGTIIMSGSSQLTGSMTVSNNISSSTLSGVGNVTIYSASVDARLDIVEATASLYIPFSTSVDSRLDYLEGPFSSSVSQEIKTLQLFTASVGLVTTASFQAFTASTNQRLNSLEVASSSLQSFSSSALISIANLNTTTASLNTSVINLNASSASQQISINALNAVSGGLATTGSNTFIGNQIVSGSLRGNVIPLTIAASTANIDCSLGNFFTLTLAGGGASTSLTATNIQPGETITLRVTQNTTTGSLTYPSYIKFPNFGGYVPTPSANAVDILTFVTLDSTTLYGVNVKNMI
jgi:hypothetical protein